jgi:putative transposase
MRRKPYEIHYNIGMSWYRRNKTPSGTYFFTLVTYRRRRILTDDTCRQWLREAIQLTRRNRPFIIDAWVLMPDHMHCLWTLPEGDADYATRWKVIKTEFSKRAGSTYHKQEWMTRSKRKRRESTMWQRRGWEHLIRNETDYARHFDYIHYNPVKHELVQRVQDWPYSSFHRYVKEGVYSVDWGGVVPDFGDGSEFGEP